MIEETLRKIANQIMALSEETLSSMLPRYKARMLNFTPTKQWEEAVIIYFLINGLRVKNSQFNDKIKEYTESMKDEGKSNPLIRPRLRLIKHLEPGKDTDGLERGENNSPKNNLTVKNKTKLKLPGDEEDKNSPGGGDAG